MKHNELHLPVLYRTFAIELEDRAGKADEPGEYDVAISSDAPVQRTFGFEILSHERGAIDTTLLERGLSVLEEHAPPAVGLLRDGRVSGGKLRGTLRFSNSRRGRELDADYRDGLRPYLSVGYQVLKAERPVDTADGTRTYRVTRWRPVEASIVSVPADATVGVGRSGAGAAETYPVEIEGVTSATEGRSMSTTVTRNEPPRDVRGEVATIMAMLSNNRDAVPGLDARGAEWIRDGWTPAQVGQAILDLRAASGGPRSSPSSEALEGMFGQLTRRDRARYSYARAVLVAAGEEEGGIEQETHRELERRAPVGTKRNSPSLLVPLDLRTSEERWEARALDSKTVAKGPELVYDQPGEVIELLRTRTAVIELGAQVFPALASPITFPKQTAAATAVWVGENSGTDVADSDVGYGYVTLLPKTLMASTGYSRQLLAQSSFDVENMVREDFGAIHARAIDKAAFHGKAADGQPTGLYMWPGVVAKAMGGAVDFGELIDMAGALGDANADLGTQGYATTALMAAAQMKTLVAQAAGSDMVWQGTLRDGRVAGYRAVATNQLSKVMNGSDETGGSSHGLVFGNWADLVIGMWGALEIVVDPYSKKKRGLIELTSFQMADIVIRHGESFVKATGATP